MKASEKVGKTLPVSKDLRFEHGVTIKAGTMVEVIKHKHGKLWARFNCDGETFTIARAPHHLIGGGST